ncbi:MAG: NFYB/HAP3 family transcription factor subunit [Candidatus Woesearchaeota archaeon]
MVKRSLPLSSMERILKKCGAERVSDEAKKALKAVIEERATAIAQKAIKIAEHTGRKTVKGADIRLAVRR